jgi:hypothetical protein
VKDLFEKIAMIEGQESEAVRIENVVLMKSVRGEEPDE